MASALQFNGGKAFRRFPPYALPACRLGQCSFGLAQGGQLAQRFSTRGLGLQFNGEKPSAFSTLRFYRRAGLDSRSFGLA